MNLGTCSKGTLWFYTAAIRLQSRKLFPLHAHFTIVLNALHSRNNSYYSNCWKGCFNSSKRASAYTIDVAACALFIANTLNMKIQKKNDAWQILRNQKHASLRQPKLNRVVVVVVFA